MQEAKNKKTDITNVEVDKDLITTFVSKNNDKQYFLLNLEDGNAVFISKKFLRESINKNKISVGIVKNWDYSVIGDENAKIKGYDLLLELKK